MKRIKINDTVVVISGKDKGKKGQVLEIVLDKNLVKVKGIGIITKHFKARKQGEQSGIKKVESYINISNVMPVANDSVGPCRVKFKTLEDGKKVRVCHRTGDTF